MQNRHLYQTILFMAIPVLMSLTSAANAVARNDAMQFTRADLSVEDLV